MKPIDAVALVALALACTGLAHVPCAGACASSGAPARLARAVNILIPLSAAGWGALLQDEASTVAVAAGGAVVLPGTAPATGVPGRRHDP